MSDGAQRPTFGTSSECQKLHNELTAVFENGWAKATSVFARRQAGGRSGSH